MESENFDQPQFSSPELLLDGAESLIWALLDDRIDDADLARLTNMLEEHAEVRSRYLDCVQLHVDLHEHFGQPAAGAKKAPCVLGNLASGFPAAESFPPVGQ
jgi:hypothetical protein